MPNNCRVDSRKPKTTRDAAAEKVVVNLLRKSGKKAEHFNEWTGIAAVGEEVDGGNNEREREVGGHATAPLTTFGPRNSDNAPKTGRHCEQRRES